MNIASKLSMANFNRKSLLLLRKKTFIKLNRSIHSEPKNKVEQVTVIGCGTMGGGIAQVVAQSGLYKLNMVGENDKLLNESLSRIKLFLNKTVPKNFNIHEKNLIEEKIENIISRIKISKNLELSVTDSDLIIEAITEDLTKKQEIFSILSKNCKDSALFCSNTSSILISEIGEKLINRGNLLGLHFFNPVPVMKLVEVIKTKDTTMEVINNALDFCTSLNKIPIVCRDTQGFIVNNLLIPQLIRACRLVENDIATIKDIDLAMKLGASHPMGPLELADYIGLDTVKFIIDGWHQKFPNDSAYVCPKLLSDLVKANKLGKKSGEGFYKYSS